MVENNKKIEGYDESIKSMQMYLSRVEESQIKSY